MHQWTTKEVPFVASKARVEEGEGEVKGHARVRLDECPYLHKGGEAVCADGSGRRQCDPDSPDCKLQKWREAVQAYIRGIDVSTLGRDDPQS